MCFPFENKIVTNRTTPYISSVNIFNLIFDISYKFNTKKEKTKKMRNKSSRSRALNKFYKFGMKQSVGENLEFMENR